MTQIKNINNEEVNETHIEICTRDDLKLPWIFIAGGKYIKSVITLLSSMTIEYTIKTNSNEDVKV